MGTVSFSRAVAQLPALTASADEDDYPALETLERIVLDHRPRSAVEAVAMLDVIIPDVAAGGRSDGRDLQALNSIRTMLIEP